MIATTAATFLPDSFVIKLTKNLTVLSNPDDIDGFTKKNIGFFFHEWIHYFHNVSTFHGLTSFENAVGIWSDFRYTCDPSSYSEGSASLPSDVARDLNQRLAYFRAARLSSKSTFPNKPLDELTLLSIDVGVESIPDSTYEVTKLKCNIAVIGDPESHTSVVVGAHEIMEGVAWLLEDLLNTALGEISPQSPAVPYKIVRNVFRLRVPHITDQEIVACMLCSLQDSDPPAVLAEILSELPNLAPDQSIADEMRRYALQTMSKNESWISSVIDQIERRFPVDETMAKAVKSVTGTMRRNFEHRRNDPLIELSFVESVRHDIQEMDVLVKTFGSCCVIQERSGEDDELTRDLMYDFVTQDVRDERLEFGWRKLHAAFHFMQIHMAQAGGFNPTNQLPASPKRRCPFYTTCDLPLRSETPHVCRNSPWEWSKSEDVRDTMCWYAAASIASMKGPSA